MHTWWVARRGVLAHVLCPLQKMGMTEDDKRSCCLLEIQETEAKYYRTLEDIEKVGTALATGTAAAL